jgi:hypothetical protein
VPRPNWSCVLPRPIEIPEVMTLQTLGDVRKLLGHLPTATRAKSTWQLVAAKLDEAAHGGDAVDVFASLQLVMLLDKRRIQGFAAIEVELPATISLWGEREGLLPVGGRAQV